MDPKIIVRTVAVLLLAGSVLACAVDLARRDHESEPPPPAAGDAIDPLAAEFARCKALGAEAVNDSACKTAWAKTRDRSFGPGEGQSGHRIDPFPATPNASAPKATPKIFLDRAPATSRPNTESPPGMGSEGR
jgi:conjugative transfer region protein TrbK